MNALKCPVCGILNSNLSYSCINCGNEISRLTRVQGLDTLRCPRCLTLNHQNNHYCINCRESLSKGKITPQHRHIQTLPSFQNVSAQQQCPTCYTYLPHGNWKFCTSCGSSLHQLPSQASYRLQPIKPAVKKSSLTPFCPNCGYNFTPRDEFAQFCPICRFRLMQILSSQDTNQLAEFKYCRKDNCRYIGTGELILFSKENYQRELSKLIQKGKISQKQKELSFLILQKLSIESKHSLISDFGLEIAYCPICRIKTVTPPMSEKTQEKSISDSKFNIQTAFLKAIELIYESPFILSILLFVVLFGLFLPYTTFVRNIWDLVTNPSNNYLFDNFHIFLYDVFLESFIIIISFNWAFYELSQKNQVNQLFGTEYDSLTLRTSIIQFLIIFSIELTIIFFALALKISGNNFESSDLSLELFINLIVIYGANILLLTFFVFICIGLLLPNKIFNSLTDKIATTIRLFSQNIILILSINIIFFLSDGFVQVLVFNLSDFQNLFRLDLFINGLKLLFFGTIISVLFWQAYSVEVRNLKEVTQKNLEKY
ncbi:MAG: hypothetical protein ACXAC7_11975 [Candidatus Hodarchaeales archaeon]|jgi:hypothetical protein